MFAALGTKVTVVEARPSMLSFCDDEIVGALGDRLKIRVAQPPEGGRANEAIRALLAHALGVSERDIELVQGQANPQKSFRVRAASAQASALAARLAGQD